MLQIQVSSHKFFRRDGDNLHLELPLTLREACLGAHVPVPTPHGEVKLTVPPHTQSGSKLRLRGKGVRRKNKPAGDLYVRFLVLYPDGNEMNEVLDSLPEQPDPRQNIEL